MHSSGRDGKRKHSMLFLTAIVDFGNRPDQIGVDMILRDVIAEQKDLRGSEVYQGFMQRLYREMADAHETGKRTLTLRLTTLFAETQPEGTNRRKLHTILLREQDLDRAGPLTLLVIGREAGVRNEPATRRAAYETLLKNFGASDFTLDALWALAQHAWSVQAYDEVNLQVVQILERYPTVPVAGEAQKLRADVFRMQGRPAEAIAAYTVLLGVRDWRGPLFPEALYWIGKCHLEQGNLKEAFAYFQRVYVLYGAHTTWVAKAYLQSAYCLDHLGRRSEAIATLQEMLGTPSLAERPECVEAREHLARWEDDAE